MDDVLFAILLPAISMRLLAEERKLGTLSFFDDAGYRV